MTTTCYYPLKGFKVQRYEGPEGLNTFPGNECSPEFGRPGEADMLLHCARGQDTRPWRREWLAGGGRRGRLRECGS